MESDLDEELRFHLEREIEKNVRRGMSPEEARTEALRRFGGVEKTKDEVREADRAVLLETVLQDIRYGARSLRKNPGYAAAAILTLALGIGANTAIFSVVHGVLLQSLPYGGGDRLVRLRADAPGAGIEDGAFSPLDVADLAAQSRSLSGVAEYHSMWFVLLGRKEPERVQTGVVSDRFFDLLGVRPILGRTFLPGEDKKGAEAVLVLSYDYWMRSFGGDPSVVGRVFEMNDRPHTVVGVLPPIPGYPDDNDVYMPVHACPFRSAERTENDRSAGMLDVFGRLKPGVTLAAARKDLDAIAAHWVHDYPKDYPTAIGLKLSPVPLTDELTRSARPTFLVLLATVGLVLLLACANVANLTLARLIRREKEMALRSALGAGRGRLTRQLLTESVLLALLGGGLGLVLAWGVHGLLVHFAARFTPRAGEIAIDGPVLLFTLGVSVATGVAFGLLPSFSPRKRPHGRAPAGRRPGLGLRRPAAPAQPPHRGAGRDLVRAPDRRRADAAHALEAQADRSGLPHGARADLAAGPELLALHQRRRAPDVPRPAARPARHGAGRRLGRARGHLPAQRRRRTRQRTLPPRGGAAGGGPRDAARGLPADQPRLLPDDRRPAAPGEAVRAHRPARDPARRDREPRLRAALLRRQGPDREDGSRSRTARRDEETPWTEIVGVVGDVRQYGLSNPPTEQIYLPIAQYPGLGTKCLVRTSADPLLMESTVTAAVHTIGPEQPVDHFRTLEQVREGTLDSPRLTAMLLVLFAILAVAITATGIAGVISFSVGQRIQEFGIRMALGAAPRAVLRMVLRQALALVVAGLVLGLVAALALARLMSGLLYDIAPTDPATYLAVALVLFGAAFIASFVPARRATTVDPMIALRSA